MRPINTLLAALLATGALAAIPSQSLGQVGQVRPQTGPNPALIAGRQAVKDAQADVTAAQKDIARIRTKVQGSFEGKKEYAKAQAAIRKYKKAYDAAVRKAKAELLKDEEYADALARREAAKNRLDSLNASGGSNEDINKAAQEVTEVGLALKKTEMEAIEANDAVAAAKEKWEQARRSLEALDDELTEALEADEEYINAQQQLELAKEQLALAKQTLAEQVRMENEARAAQRAANRPQRNTGQRR